MLVNKEIPGFIANRMMGAINREALDLAAAGVASIEDIDTTARTALGHPMGPFELMDLVGLDVVDFIAKATFDETGRQEDKPHALILADLGLLAELEMATGDRADVDADPEVLLRRNPGAHAAFAGFLDVGLVLEHLGGAVHHDGPCLVGEDSVGFEGHLVVDGHGSELVARCGAQEELALVNPVVDRDDIDITCDGGGNATVRGMGQKFPGLLLVQDEDRMVVVVVVFHTLIFLRKVENCKVCDTL